MNKIRERVIGGDGRFHDNNLPENKNTQERINQLQHTVDRLSKKLRELDKFKEEQRSVDMVKLTDKVQGLERKVGELRTENDRLKKKSRTKDS